jgi:hypothetical protein
MCQESGSEDFLLADIVHGFAESYHGIGIAIFLLDDRSGSASMVM